MKNQSLITKLKAKGFKLNQQQAEAVSDINGISIVQAGPGAGKTNLLAAKITNICMSKPCSSVLAISFTKKAVAELQSRLLGHSNVTVSTFHSWFYRILRMDYGYRHFKFISNEAERKSLIRRAINWAVLDEEVTVDEVSSALSKGVFEREEVKIAAEAYLELLKDHHLLCFDSLQYFVLELLQNNKSICRSVYEAYDSLLLDEAQDANQIQLNILSTIQKPTKEANITVIGDPNQSIYGWLGSKMSAMQTIYDIYSAPGAVGCRQYQLDINYRSYQNILDVAKTVLPEAPEMHAARNGKAAIEFKACADAKAEADYVIAKILKLHEEGVPFRDIAVMFRSGHVSNVLFEELITRGIPVVKIGSDALRVNNSRFKALLAMLALIYDPAHSAFYCKCVMPILGISPSICKYIDDVHGEQQDLPIKDILLSIPSLSKNQKARIFDFFSIDPKQMTFFKIIDTLWNIYLKDYFKAEEGDDSILEDFYDIIGDCRSFNELRDYVFRIRRHCKAMEKLKLDPSAQYLTLSSVHSLKGGEYGHCFIIGCYDGAFPSAKAEDLAEENRLAYVAVTRAKNGLYVSYPIKSSKESPNTPSPFFANLFNDK